MQLLARRGGTGAGGARFKLVIVGQGPMRRTLVANLPDAHFTGPLEGAELSRWYASADVFVFPSIAETFGNVVLEAFASGLPVVGVDAGSVRELVIPHSNGCLAPVDSPATFADHVHSLLQRPAELARLASGARATAAQYRWPDVNRQLLERYERLIAYVHENPRLYARRAAGLVTRYLRAAHRGFHLAVAASEANLSGLGVPRTAVIPLGVDTELFHPARRDPAWKGEVGAAAGQAVALYVGRLSAEKGLDVVLAALPEIHAVTGARLVLIGEGHLRRRLERAARAPPGMLAVLPFEPDRARLARAYASADLFLAPCPYETFGLAALEAMASGLPVVGVDSAGIGRLLTDADWGRLYRVGDARDCSRAVRELLALELPALVRRARTVVDESHGG